MKKLALFLLVIGCNNTPLYPSEPPNTNLCNAGCENLKKLGCEEGKGSNQLDKDSCKNDCEYSQKIGLIDLNVKCWVEITRCEDLEIKCR